MILNIKKISILALAMASLAACDLDVIPPSDIAAESIWKTDKDAWCRSITYLCRSTHSKPRME